MIPKMTVNITRIHVEHYIVLLTTLSKLSKGKKMEEKEQMLSCIFSQWDVKTDACILIDGVYIVNISEYQSVCDCSSLTVL